MSRTFSRPFIQQVYNYVDEVMGSDYWRIRVWGGNVHYQQGRILTMKYELPYRALYRLYKPVARNLVAWTIDTPTYGRAGSPERKVHNAWKKAQFAKFRTELAKLGEQSVKDWDHEVCVYNSLKTAFLERLVQVPTCGEIQTKLRHGRSTFQGTGVVTLGATLTIVDTSGMEAAGEVDYRPTETVPEDYYAL